MTNNQHIYDHSDKVGIKCKAKVKNSKPIPLEKKEKAKVKNSKPIPLEKKEKDLTSRKRQEVY